MLSRNPSWAPSQPQDSEIHWASASLSSLPGPEGGPRQSQAGAARGPGVCRGTCWPGPGSQAHRGRAQRSRGTKAQQNPFPPRLLPLPGSGWGTPIVLLSGGEQTKKRLPGAAGRLTEPFLCLPERRLAAASAWPFFALLPGGDVGVRRRMATVKIARAASIVPVLMRAAPDGYLSDPLWAGWTGA